MAFLLCAPVIFSQNVNIRYEKSEIFRDKHKYSNIISIDQDAKGNVVIVRSYYGGVILKLKGYLIEHYDTNLNLIKEYDYPADPFKKVMGVLVSDNTIHILEVFYDRKKKGYSYIANSSSLDKISFNKKELLTVEAREEKEINFLENFTSTFQGAYYSQLLFDTKGDNFIITVDSRRKKHKMHKVFWFDKHLNKKLEYNFEGTFTNKNFVVESFTVAPNGKELFISGKAHFVRKKSDMDIVGRYQYELFKIDEHGSTKQQFDSSDHQIASLKPVFVKDRLLAVGFYSKRGLNRYNGLEFFELDKKSLNFIKKKKNPFSHQFMIDKYGSDKDKEVDNLIFRDLHVTEKGELIFNAEEYFYTKNYQTNSSGSGMWVYRHHYNDIVCAKMDSEGTMEWARNINKKEVTTGDEAYVSYTSLTHNNSTLFFINSGERPQKISKERLLFKDSYTRTPDVFAVQIDNNGLLDYAKVLEEVDAAAPVMVSRGIVDKSGEAVYFLARKGSRKQLIKMLL